MLIPASLFSTLPEGCPVLVGDAVLPGTIREPIGKGYRVAIAGAAPMAGGAPSTMIAWAPRMQVDLSTPAAVRAFAPALICAVRGLPNAPKYPPGVVLDDDYGEYTLIDSVQHSDDGLGARRLFVGAKGVYAATPEACMLAGLKAALDAAKDAQ